jgi:hypothetical protein
MSENAFDLESEDQQRFPLPGLPCIVGRGEDSDLRLDLDRISRRHARFETNADGLWLSDMDSTNGTFVNNERISSATRVSPGDRIHFANHAYTLRRHEGAHQPLSLMADDDPPARAGDTMVGFTALPTGFPVQAPEFFELLNDEQLTATRQAIKNASGQQVGFSLNARSNHPGLAADARILFRLAEQLGEEVRLATLIRKHALMRADQAGIQASLFLKAHPVECDESEALLEELASHAQRYRHLALVFDLPISTLIDADSLARIHEQLAALGAELCGRVDEPIDTDRLAAQSQHLDYVRLVATGSQSLVARVAGIVGPSCRILVDDIHNDDEIQPLAEAGASLFQGQAIGPREDF